VTELAGFPRLAGPRYVDYADADVTFRLGTPPDDLVNRLHLVAVTPLGEVLVCESDRGWRYLPGGTREPGETLPQLAARELVEEAGARLLEPASVFGYFEVSAQGPAPYRAHLAHPQAAWAVGLARVEIVGPPTCPEDGEQITAVRRLSPEDAAAHLETPQPDPGRRRTTGRRARLDRPAGVKRLT
jgi:8-oxo-dGTP diphosphatase